MIARRLFATGTVQGVGFRPFVYALATQLQLAGWVKNTSGGVEIVIQGGTGEVRTFLERLLGEQPPLAHIVSLEVRSELPCDYADFEIRESIAVVGALLPIPPDIAICADCERELFDPDDRRYLYPFTNCTNCGPRLTIIEGLPYDRDKTTMAAFEMCAACRQEYEEPLDRRFHAQPIACPKCGPTVELRSADGAAIASGTRAILETRRLLRQGKTVAIKGVGGFHLACDATNGWAVQELRLRKGRAEKPFALMAADLRVIETACTVEEGERILLEGHEKPIVLLRTRRGAPISEHVAPGLDRLGMMLPYTPLHHLLLASDDPVLAAEPAPPVLVMTSGNFSEEPIATDNLDALQRLRPLADAFLLHNRDILTRCDDSVVRVSGRPAPRRLGAQRGPLPRSFLRRSRGYAPFPVQLPIGTRPTLAVGGDLKNAFCLSRGHNAFLSQHIGDMENVETYESLERGVAHFSRLFHIEPELVAHDLHPNYYTTHYAHGLPHEVQRMGIQHHHAHIAACMADNGLDNHKVIGVAFDGTGYGTDGAIWGSEFLTADYAGFERAGQLEYLPLAGADAAIRHPWRIAVSYASSLGLTIDDLPSMQAIDAKMRDSVRGLLERRLNTVQTSSMGRLFDSVASLAGVRNEVSYEAQAAIELEVMARPHLTAVPAYPYSVEICEGRLLIVIADLLASVIDDARRGEAPGCVGARFHKSIAAATGELCRRIADAQGLEEVVLSGGVWQNEILLTLVCESLDEHGLTVYLHRETPCNDGGLALGQAVIANCQAELDAASGEAAASNPDMPVGRTEA
jgi:hydrogenase maturation protein HypF